VAERNRSFVRPSQPEAPLLLGPSCGGVVSRSTNRPPPTAIRTEVAGELRRFRRSRGLSQLSLALSAGVSARHLSFIETGRSHPGREVLLKIGRALDLAEGEWRSLIVAGGYSAPFPSRGGVSASELASLAGQVSEALLALEPLPAVLVDAHWDVIMANRPYVRLHEILLGSSQFARGPLQITDLPRPNRVRELLDPALRGKLLDWEGVARSVLRRLDAEARSAWDPLLQSLLDEAARTSGLRVVPVAEAFPLRMHFSVGAVSLRLFSIVATWAVERPGLRVELLLPVDERSARALTRLVNPLERRLEP
jgi:transcriptional regulator with XRE-family HTH domain